MRYGIIGLIILGWITGCGFKLRGAQAIPAQLKTIFLRVDNTHDTLHKELASLFRARGITLATSAKQSPYTLEILNSRLEQTIASTSTDMQVRNYLIIYSLQYQVLRSNGEIILPPQTITLTRPYVANTTQLLNDSYDFSTIKQNLRQDALDQMLERLRSVNNANQLR